MKKIDALMLAAKKQGKAVNPKIVEYLEYWYHVAVCEYNNIENDRKPPEGYNEWISKPIKQPDPDSPDYLIDAEIRRLIFDNDTENDTKLTMVDLV